MLYTLYSYDLKKSTSMLAQNALNISGKSKISHIHFIVYRKKKTVKKEKLLLFCCSLDWSIIDIRCKTGPRTGLIGYLVKWLVGCFVCKEKGIIVCNLAGLSVGSLCNIL